MSGIETQRSPTLVETLEAAVDEAVGEIYSMLPGKIEVYNPVLQSASVKPLIKRRFVGDDGKEDKDVLPVIMDVPILFPRGGGYFLTFPLAPGDNVTLLFADRSIDDYLYGDGAIDTDPKDLRRYDITDAVAIPSFYPFVKGIKDVVASGAVLGKEGGYQVRVGEGSVDVVTGGAPSSLGGFVALALKVDAELTKIKTALNTHVHTGTQPGTGSSGTSISGYVQGPVASANLKAD